MKFIKTSITNTMFTLEDLTANDMWVIVTAVQEFDKRYGSIKGSSLSSDLLDRMKESGALDDDY